MSLVARMGELTTLTKASSKFESLRTTVPKSIVNQWRLNPGDQFDWNWEVKDGKMILIVSKVVTSKKK
jgi:hypothetical protein